MGRKSRIQNGKYVIPRELKRIIKKEALAKSLEDRISRLPRAFRHQDSQIKPNIVDNRHEIQQEIQIEIQQDIQQEIQQEIQREIQQEIQQKLVILLINQNSVILVNIYLIKY
jgi:hypothetical protein